MTQRLSIDGRKMNRIKRLLLKAFGTLLSLLPRTWVAEMFRLAGAQLGVTACACAGELGVFEARLSDRGVLGYYLVHHTWEPGIQLLLARLAEPGTGTFIDVGANVGFTLIPLKRRYPLLKVVGVEADAENFGHLSRNLLRNGITDAVLHQRAVHSTAGELEFERSDRNAGDHRVRLSVAGTGNDLYGEGDRSVVRVRCDRLDDLVDAGSLFDRVGMKVDIQGAEVHFLEGAQSVLARTDWLVIEYWPYGIMRAGSRPEDFFRKLASLFPFGGIIDTNSNSLPRLMPVHQLLTQVTDHLGHEAETAHCELIFAKTPELPHPD